MAWKATGQPTVRKQRDKWVVRVDGIDTATGKHRLRQLGTYASQRSANAAARSMKIEDRSTERGTVQSSRIDREDVGRGSNALAAGGKLGRRSIQICLTVLRAALSEAVDEGLIPRSPAARVGLPRTVAKEVKQKDAVAWDAADVDRFLEATAERLAAGSEWEDNDLIIATGTGRLVLPRSSDRALATIVDNAGLPRLTSHGLRHTAATHMVQRARDVGELRAIADLLGHSPEMLMNTYAHVLPQSQTALVDRISRRT